jgi:hypothetical protein
MMGMVWDELVVRRSCINIVATSLQVAVNEINNTLKMEILLTLFLVMLNHYHYF